MNNFFTHFSWGAYSSLWLMPFVALIGTCVALRIIYTKSALALLVRRHLMLLTNQPTMITYVLRLLFLTTSSLLLVLALMRPRIARDDQKISQSVRDLFIVLDISRSMLAADDNGQQRLMQAKKKIADLVRYLAQDRVGLILFSGTAFVHCPLTTDYEAFNLFLNAVDVESISSGTTALDKALKKALETFEQIPDRKTKLVILFTDGEDFSTDLAGFKERAKEQNLLVFACGVGSVEGAPIPLIDAQGNTIGHQKDNGGSIVISRLNEVMLQELCQQLGGFYCSSKEHDMKRLATAIDSFEKETLAQKEYRTYTELYPYLLFVSFCFLCLEWLL